MAGLPQQGFEAMLRDLVSRLGQLERSLGSLRSPRMVVSDARPDPSDFRPGTRLFETDTNRSIFVNATQDGYVDVAGTAL
jgi:hypothetical protein